MKWLWHPTQKSSYGVTTIQTGPSRTGSECTGGAGGAQAASDCMILRCPVPAVLSSRSSAYVFMVSGVPSARPGRIGRPPQSGSADGPMPGDRTGRGTMA